MSIRNEFHFHWKSGGVLKRLLFINIGVFLAIRTLSLIDWLSGRSGMDLRVLEYLMASGDGKWMLHKPWTLITHMFTHFDVRHIISNMFIFWFSGQLFQGLLGERRLLGTYLLGGLCGFLLYVLGGFTPAHLQLQHTHAAMSEARDRLRAELVRRWLAP